MEVRDGCGMEVGWRSGMDVGWRWDGGQGWMWDGGGMDVGWRWDGGQGWMLNGGQGWMWDGVSLLLSYILLVCNNYLSAVAGSNDRIRKPCPLQPDSVYFSQLGLRLSHLLPWVR